MCGCVCVGACVRDRRAAWGADPGRVKPRGPPWGGSETRLGRGEHPLGLARRPWPQGPAERPGRRCVHAFFLLWQ